MQEYTNIQKIAYGKYQLDWMIRHGYTLSDLREIFTEIAGEEIEENPDDIPITGSETIIFADTLCKRFLMDIGFNGSCFACIDEFLENEYTDSYYISHLLSNAEFNEYISETVIAKPKEKKTEEKNDFSNLEITEITLLNVEEAEKLPQKFRKCIIEGIPSWWWLRTPGGDQNNASYVYYDGSVYYYGHFVSSTYIYVRPALKISNLESLNLKEYDIIRIFNKDWIVIAADTVLCKDAIGRMAFRQDKNAPDANDYERSDVKKYIEHWLKEQLAEEK